jgi:hypothetical protein
MNWKKHGINFGLLRDTFPVLPYKGSVKPRKITDRLLGDRTKAFFPRSRNANLFVKIGCQYIEG